MKICFLVARNRNHSLQVYFWLFSLHNTYLLGLITATFYRELQQIRKNNVIHIDTKLNIIYWTIFFFILPTIMNDQSQNSPDVEIRICIGAFQVMKRQERASIRSWTTSDTRNLCRAMNLTPDTVCTGQMLIQ